MPGRDGYADGRPAFLTVKEEVIPQATIAENLDA